jgi:hypothetical protein
MAVNGMSVNPGKRSNCMSIYLEILPWTAVRHAPNRTKLKIPSHYALLTLSEYSGEGVAGLRIRNRKTKKPGFLLLI